MVREGADLIAGVRVNAFMNDFGVRWRSFGRSFAVRLVVRSPALAALDRAIPLWLAAALNWLERLAAPLTGYCRLWPEEIGRAGDDLD